MVKLSDIYRDYDVYCYVTPQTEEDAIDRTDGENWLMTLPGDRLALILNLHQGAVDRIKASGEFPTVLHANGKLFFGQFACLVVNQHVLP